MFIAVTPMFTAIADSLPLAYTYFITLHISKISTFIFATCYSMALPIQIYQHNLLTKIYVR